MSGFEDAASYLPALAQRFDANLRTKIASDPQLRGWGQFISAEAHHDQIGPYGTSAGLLARSLAGVRNPVDPGIRAYLADIWDHHGGTRHKYFAQNIRLAFMVLGLSKVPPSETELIALRENIAAALRERQKPDGSWGDWFDPQGTESAPRSEPTTWCAFALAQLQGTQNRSAAARGAEYLQKLALASISVEASQDPFAIAVVCSVLSSKKLDRATEKAAVRMLRAAVKEDPLRIVIYFFDYIDASGAVKRDYLCVPAVFVTCILTCAVVNARKGALWSLWTSRSAWSALTALRSATSAELFKPRQASYASTVDQALVALGAAQIASIKPVWGDALPYVAPVMAYLGRSMLSRVLLPGAALFVLISLATNPQGAGDVWAALFKAPPPDFQKFLVSISGVLQVLSAFLLVLFGQSMVNSIFDWIRQKIGAD